MEYALFFIAGMILGGMLIFFLKRKEFKNAEELLSRLKESMGSLSLEALSKNSEEFLKLANQTLSKQTEIGEKELEGKKKLIDQTLEEMKKNLLNVQEMVTGFEKDREEKFGALSNQLRNTAEQTGKLQETANQLKTALAGSKTRGQWGERMAEDVLRLAGFIEGVNYAKQKTISGGSTRPDYTFFLPQGLIVNMDVKFPLDNYLKYLDGENETEKKQFRTSFLNDVKQRLKEVTTRDYINPSDNTVDYVLVFIPNEQVYSFINENDQSILDEALKKKVILCSPLTLYAILAVIRQAVDNFNIEKTAAEIIKLLGGFKKQWDMFIDSFDKMGKKIEEAQKEYDHLLTTRRNQLDRKLKDIDELKESKRLSEKSGTED